MQKGFSCSPLQSSFPVANILIKYLYYHGVCWELDLELLYLQVSECNKYASKNLRSSGLFAISFPFKMFWLISSLAPALITHFTDYIFFTTAKAEACFALHPSVTALPSKML